MTEFVLRGVDGAVDLDVLVQPRASRAKVGPEHAGRLKIAVTAPPSHVRGSTAAWSPKTAIRQGTKGRIRTRSPAASRSR